MLFSEFATSANCWSPIIFPIFLPISWPKKVLETYLAVLSLLYPEFNDLHIHKNKIQHSGKDLNLDTES